MKRPDENQEIQLLKRRVERLERKAFGSQESLESPQCSDIEELEPTEESSFTEVTKEVEINGRKETLIGRRFGPWRAGRMCEDKCNWKEKEYVTIWPDGQYEHNTLVKCEHGWAFACYFESTIHFYDSNGIKITTATWSKKLAGGDEHRQRGRRYSGAIWRSYSDIADAKRSRYAEC